MQAGPFVRDVMKDVLQGLRRSVEAARKAGVAKSQIILDPGIGFGKSFAQNYELLQKLPQLAKLGYPLLLALRARASLGRPWLGAASLRHRKNASGARPRRLPRAS